LHPANTTTKTNARKQNTHPFPEKEGFLPDFVFPHPDMFKVFKSNDAIALD